MGLTWARWWSQAPHMLIHSRDHTESPRGLSSFLWEWNVPRGLVCPFQAVSFWKTQKFARNKKGIPGTSWTQMECSWSPESTADHYDWEEGTLAPTVGTEQPASRIRAAGPRPAAKHFFHCLLFSSLKRPPQYLLALL